MTLHFSFTTSSTFEDEPEAGGDISYIYIFGAVTLFLILIASINYMNLATSRSMKRSLEAGGRKVMGAQRGMIKCSGPLILIRTSR